ncbi:Signal peptidase complex subunit [Komagataella phaffii CBS 7435]|nr:Signal peptidase complex subunit [Komagataella phaffii CBS 7435]
MSFSYLEGNIDFKGQELANRITKKLITFGAIISFLVGFLSDNILYTVYTFAAFGLLTASLVIPPFSFYKKNPVTWLPKKSKIEIQH